MAAALAAASSSSCCARLKLHGGVGTERNCLGPSRVKLPRRPTMTTKAVMTASSPSESPRSRSLLKTTKQEKVEQKRNKRRTRDSNVTPDEIEQWVADSVGEILKNMDKTPFLVNIFSNGDRHKMSLKTQKASPEDWSKIKLKWDRDGRNPDAVILVEELTPEDEEDGGSPTLPAHTEAKEAGGGGLVHRGHRPHPRHRMRSGAATSASSRKTLGLVVQGGGGVGRAATCYILDTTRVGSAFGFCTHFCLTRATLGEPLDVQLRKIWLV